MSIFDFKRESANDLLIHFDGVGEEKIKNYIDFTSSSMFDFPKIPGDDEDFFDFRGGNFRIFQVQSNVSNPHLAYASRIISNRIFVKLRVYDVIKQYKLQSPPPADDSSKDFAIFSKTAGTVKYSFRHLLTSDHVEVGGTSGNTHQSKFYFEVMNSGPICESPILSSLDQDLGFEWAYLAVERGMWDVSTKFRMMTNLMATECLYEVNDPTLNWVDSSIIMIGNDHDTGWYHHNFPPIFFYDFETLIEGTGGYFLGPGDAKRKQNRLKW